MSSCTGRVVQRRMNGRKTSFHQVRQSLTMDDNYLRGQGAILKQRGFFRLADDRHLTTLALPSALVRMEADGRSL